MKFGAFGKTSHDLKDGIVEIAQGQPMGAHFYKNVTTY